MMRKEFTLSEWITNLTSGVDHSSKDCILKVKQQKEA
jgi:hypothetical protein